MMAYVLVFVGWKPRRRIAGTYTVGGTARLGFKAAPDFIFPQLLRVLGNCLMMDITLVVLTAFLGWLRIMSIFSWAYGLRWLLNMGMKEDEEAILQVSTSFGG